jgi:hypothetical protein
MENISKHISYEEATFSPEAKKLRIDNTPDKDNLENMKALAEKVFEPIREKFDVPIYIHSFYRSPKLNKAVGGSKTSQHMALEGSAAIDIDFEVYKRNVTNKEAFDWIRKNIEFDQLIAEDIDENDNINWIHISYNRFGKNRGQVMKMIVKVDENGERRKIYEEY